MKDEVKEKRHVSLSCEVWTLQSCVENNLTVSAITHIRISQIKPQKDRWVQGKWNKEDKKKRL